MKSPRGVRIGVSVLLVLALALSSYAQTETATLSGRVTDPQGAVVPRAQVQATNIDTNVKAATETNDAGIYVVSNLRPGRYRIIVRKDGFKEIVKTGVLLHVQDVVAHNFSLEVGSVAQSITVVAEAGAVSTSPSVSTVVDRQFVENLPLNGRSIQQLITLAPGVVLTPTYSSEQGQFSVNGQRANANYFMIDGVSANIGISASSFQPTQSLAGTLPGFSTFGGTNNLVSIDTLEEFRIQTSTYAPEFGRTPGGQISLVTRSGTNEFHGTLFNYFRNDALDANDWFNNFFGFPKTALRQNDFGGVFEGPIYKNRTFFLFSYEGLRLRLPRIVSSEVPSLALRQSAPTGFQPYLNAFPQPNGPPTSPGLEEFTGAYSEPSSLDAVSLRMDDHMRDKFRLFGRYSYASSETAERGRDFLALSTVETFKVTTQTLTVGATLIATPGITNDLRVNYSRNRGASLSTLDDFGGAVVPPDSVVFPPFVSRNDAIIDVFVHLGDHGTLEVGKNSTPLARQVNVVDNLSVVSGTHQLKFGVDYRYLFPLTDIYNYNLQWGFFDLLTSTMAGTADFVFVDAFQGPQGLIYHNLSLYAQDTWRMTPRLTLTYGLRWELNPPPSEQSGKAAAVATGVDSPTTMALAPAGTPLWRTTYNNFAPRVGVAYQLVERPGWEIVLRGGFGIFYDLGTGPAGNPFNFAYPFLASKGIFTPEPVPLPLAVVEPVPFGGPPTDGSFFWLFDSNLKLPRSYQWNVALEQGLGAKQSFSASYVASVGRRLLRQEIWNDPSPDVPGVVRITRNGAAADYHALQLQFQRRLSRGLQALGSYTWSHSIDMASQESPLHSIHPPEIEPRLDRGDSNFDVRHAFSGSLTYDIPTLHAGRLGSAILRDWSVDTIVMARSALPLDVTYLTVASFGFTNLRPDVVSGVPVWLDDPNVPAGRRINPAAFAIPTTERQGTLPRNGLRGFGAWQADLAVRRRFNLGERVNLLFRAEFFNVFNHPNFGDPGGAGDFFGNVLGFACCDGLLFPISPRFGESASTLARSLGGGGRNGGFSPLYQIGGPRSIQLALRLQF